MISVLRIHEIGSYWTVFIEMTLFAKRSHSAFGAACRIAL
jgi:hypothetical protein